MKSLLHQIYYAVIYYIHGVCKEKLHRNNKTNSLVVKSYFNMKWGKFSKNNLRDDMDYYLCEIL